MKKVSLFTMALAVACIFAACTKDGVYNPKEKISEVYISESSAYTYGGTTTSNSTPKYMSEKWTWNGKQLTSISYYNTDGAIESTTTFSYDGKQLSEIKLGNNVSKLTYDGSKLSKIESFNGNELLSTATVTHDGKKIVKIEFENYDSDKACKDAKAMAFKQTVMKFIMPVYTENTAEMLNTISTKGTDKYTMEFEWSGKNISKVTMKDAEGSNTITYSYDEMKNPYKGFFYFIENPAEYGSQNNVVSETFSYVEDGQTENYTYNYTYEYDGKWPETKTYTHGYSESVLGNEVSYTSTRVTYFEYDD